jgi:lysophospholipase L1-like esterase
VKLNSVKIITVLSLVATVMWVVGLSFTINDQFFNNPPPSVEKSATISTDTTQKKDVSIVAIGDSLTRGNGDSTGKGYVQYMLNDLKSKTKKKVNLSNLAISGYTSQQLISQLKQTEMQRQIRQSDIVVMTIGANDLFQGGTSLTNYKQSNIDALEKTYLSNLKEIYGTIRKINPQTTVYHIGLYNPFIELSDAKITSNAVRKWNFDTADLAATFEKFVLVPTFDLFQLNVNNYLADDKFHPNSMGYQLVGNRVASLITFEKENEKNE